MEYFIDTSIGIEKTKTVIVQMHGGSDLTAIVQIIEHNSNVKTAICFSYSDNIIDGGIKFLSKAGSWSEYIVCPPNTDANSYVTGYHRDSWNKIYFSMINGQLYATDMNGSIYYIIMTPVE